MRLSYKGNSKNQILKNYINGFFWMLLKNIKVIKVIKNIKVIKKILLKY